MAIVHFISKCSTIEAKKHRRLDHDEYRGTPAELIAAGIITHDQLPGQPGRNKTMVTINARKGRVPGPDYLQIRLIGKTAVVKVGVPAAVRARRIAEHEAFEDQLHKFNLAIDAAGRICVMDKRKDAIEARAACGEQFARAWVKRYDADADNARQKALEIIRDFNSTIWSKM